MLLILKVKVTMDINGNNLVNTREPNHLVDLHQNCIHVNYKYVQGMNPTEFGGQGQYEHVQK